jgi:hypothetical protein
MLSSQPFQVIVFENTFQLSKHKLRSSKFFLIESHFLIHFRLHLITKVLSKCGMRVRPTHLEKLTGHHQSPRQWQEIRNWLDDFPTCEHVCPHSHKPYVCNYESQPQTHLPLGIPKAQLICLGLLMSQLGDLLPHLSPLPLHCRDVAYLGLRIHHRAHTDSDGRGGVQTASGLHKTFPSVELIPAVHPHQVGFGLPEVDSR